MIYNKIVLFCALQPEAKPLIKSLNLKRNDDVSRWAVYENSDMTLIITGIGKVRSAMAVEYIIGTLNPENLSKCNLLNFGACGAVDNTQFMIGDIAIINKIIDHGSGKCFYPDMMIAHNFADTAIETFDRPVMDPSATKSPLVDMEASGFYQAASNYCPADRIFCLKMISDYLDIKTVSPKLIEELAAEASSKICNFIENLKQLGGHSPSFQFSSEELDLLHLITDNLHLTKTQQLKLNKLAEAYLIRTQHDLSNLEPFINKDVKSKHESKQYFKAIESILIKDSEQ